jgi:protein O-GlcNAc transferase
MNLEDAIKLTFEHYKRGNLQQSEDICREILIVQPNDVDLQNHLGNILRAKGNPDAAIAQYQKAIEINSNFAGSYYNLGNVLKEKGKLDEAITCYQKAIDLDPIYIGSYVNLGTVLQAKGKLDEAITYFQKALQLNPEDAYAYNNLGTVLQAKGKLDEAITYFQKALQLNPNLAEVYDNLGNVLREEGRQDEALDAYNNALNCNPKYIRALWARCMSQLPIIYPDQSSIQEARKRYYNELTKLQELKLENPSDIEEAARAVGSYQPFYLAYQGFNDRDLQQIYGNLVCNIMALRYPQFSVRPIVPVRTNGQPLRVGIVSGYFRFHSVWKIIIKNWIANLDKNKISLYGYYTGNKKDSETEKARHFFVKFVEDIYSFDDLCKIISNDNLDVMIYPEIGMDSTTLKLAALRLAPIQCASWGHPDTSGLPTIDYYLSGELMETSDSDAYYSEHLIRLPNLSVYYTPQEFSGIEMNRETFGLRPNSVLYHCCQTLFKFLPQYDVIFPRIAQQVGDCQFLFSSLPKSSFVIEQFRTRIHKAFKQFDLNPAEHVIFLPHLDPPKYSSLNKMCDIFLDPIGWSGCTSTLGAIDCNLPVIALPYFLMRGRESSAILNMLGLQETIANSVDDYASLAIKLGKDPKLRCQISDKIARNKHIIYRDRTCVTALEDFLETVVEGNLE